MLISVLVLALGAEGVGEKQLRYAFTPRMDSNELAEMDPDTVPGFQWRAGLSQRPAIEGGGLVDGFPLFAHAVLARGRQASEGGRVLYFPLKGVWSGLELAHAEAVVPGSRFRFTARIAAEGLVRSRFRIGVFWEDGRGKAVGDPQEEAGHPGAWLKGSPASQELSVRGHVPGGAVAARPYFFLAGAPEELAGGVWVVDASLLTGPALSVRFARPLLVFPPDDPVRWRLSSVGLVPGTYFIEAFLRAPGEEMQPGLASYRVVAQRDEELELAGSLGSAPGGSLERGGTFDVVFRLTGAGAIGAARGVEDEFVCTIGRLGKAGDAFAGELSRCILDFSARDLAALNCDGTLERLIEDLQVHRARVRFEGANALEPPAGLIETLRRLPHVSFHGAIGRESLPADPPALASFIGALAEHLGSWELEGGEELEPLVAGARKALVAAGKKPVRFGCAGQRPQWAEFTTVGASAPADAVPNAAWVELSPSGGELLDQALEAIARGAVAVLLPRSRQALLDETDAGSSPTALYGPWRTLGRMVGGARFVGAMPAIEGALTYSFRRGATEVVAARSVRGMLKAQIPAAGEVTAIDGWGNSRTHRAANGTAEIELAEEWTFLLGLSSGHGATVSSVRLIEATCDGTGGTLRFTARNQSGPETRLSIGEAGSGVRVEAPLASDSDTEISLKLDVDTVRRIQREKTATFSIAVREGGEEKYRRDRSFRPHWGKRRFALVSSAVSGTAFTFALASLGATPLRGHVFVAEERAEGPEITGNWSNVEFAPGKEVAFKGTLGEASASVRLLVVAEGASEPEEFFVGSGR